MCDGKFPRAHVNGVSYLTIPAIIIRTKPAVSPKPSADHSLPQQFRKLGDIDVFPDYKRNTPGRWGALRRAH